LLQGFFVSGYIGSHNNQNNSTYDDTRPIFGAFCFHSNGYLLFTVSANVAGKSIGALVFPSFGSRLWLPS
jgi:hypothetical protein